MTTPKKKILIADDEEDILIIMAEKLNEWGYEVYKARDGREALKIAEEVYPDLIISDIIMPEMDGNQLLKEVRAKDFGRDIPFIVFTARLQMKDYFETVGVSDFLEKPFKLETLREKVERVFHNEAAQAQGHKRVLVAGSHEADTEAIAALVRQETQFVDLVTHAEQVISKAVMFLPNVILLDAEFKADVAAQELVRILRQMPQFKDVPILVYNSDGPGLPGDPGAARQRDLDIAVRVNACLGAGATEYIGRFDKKILIHRIQKYLQKGIIVIIEDQAVTVRLLEKLLVKQGYKVFCAPDGESGLEMVRKVNPNIVILDIIMPGIDGYEVARLLKAADETKNIPLIMLTVKKEEGDLDHGLDLGADDYVTKPFHARLLVKRIARMIKK